MDIGKVFSAILIFIMGIIEVLIGFRIALLLFAANSSASFTDWIYGSTDPLIAPFKGVFPDITLANLITLELSSLLAMIVYGVAAIILFQLIRMFEGTKVHAPSGKSTGPLFTPNQQTPTPQMPIQQYSAPQQTYSQPPVQSAAPQQPSMSQQPTQMPPQTPQQAPDQSNWYQTNPQPASPLQTPEQPQQQ